MSDIIWGLVGVAVLVFLVEGDPSVFNLAHDYAVKALTAKQETK